MIIRAPRYMDYWVGIADKERVKITREGVLQVIDLMLKQGYTLGDALKALEYIPTTFYNFLRNHTDLYSEYSAAREFKADLYVEEIVKIADTEPDPNRARVMVDARKWYASKLQPKTYGDRIDLNVTGTIDLAGALKEARKRIGPQNDAKQVEFKEVFEVTTDKQDSFTGSSSVDGNNKEPLALTIDEILK